ncbi:MAG: hypothetical protein ACRCRQ_01735 [Metamycoplasmataceae bacterium]
MISKIKKISLGMLTISSSIIPLIAIASCSSSVDDSNFIISAKRNPQITQEDIINNNYKSLITLNKLFNGIDEDVLEKLTVGINNQNDVQIVLIANDGYKINGGKEFNSASFKVSIILNITPKEEDPQSITHVDLKNDGYQSTAVLNQLFNGIKEDEIIFMDVTISKKTPHEDFQPYRDYAIIIKPKNGYIFFNNVGQSINEFTSIDFRTVDVVLDIKELPNPIINNIDISGENFKQLSVLQKVFVGEKDLTEENIEKMEIVLNPSIDPNDNYYTITISFEEVGFLFSNGFYSLESNEFTVNKIIDVSTKTTLTEIPNHSELLEIINPLNDDYALKLEILEKLFDGITLEDIFNLQEITTLTPPMPGNNKQVVTLVANLDYVFIVNGEEVDRISSIEFVTDPVVLNIEPTNITILNNADIEGENYRSLATLSKLFYGVDDLTLENLENMQIELISNEIDGYYKIILTANEGYIFQNQNAQIESGHFFLA